MYHIKDKRISFVQNIRLAIFSKRERINKCLFGTCICIILWIICVLITLAFIYWITRADLFGFMYTRQIKKEIGSLDKAYCSFSKYKSILCGLDCKDPIKSVRTMVYSLDYKKYNITIFYPFSHKIMRSTNYNINCYKETLKEWFAELYNIKDCLINFNEFTGILDNQELMYCKSVNAGEDVFAAVILVVSMIFIFALLGIAC
jgi:hypothetical protein